MSLYFQIGHWCLRIKRTYHRGVDVLLYRLLYIGAAMFVAGFLVFLSTFMPERTAVIVACMLSVVMFVIWLLMISTRKIEDDLPATLPECPLWNISPFFRRRFDFLQRGHNLTGESIYQFKLLKVKYISTLVPQSLPTCFAYRLPSSPSLVPPHGMISSPPDN